MRKEEVKHKAEVVIAPWTTDEECRDRTNEAIKAAYIDALQWFYARWGTNETFYFRVHQGIRYEKSTGQRIAWCTLLVAKENPYLLNELRIAEDEIKKVSALRDKWCNETGIAIRQRDQLRGERDKLLAAVKDATAKLDFMKLSLDSIHRAREKERRKTVKEKKATCAKPVFFRPTEAFID